MPTFLMLTCACTQQTLDCDALRDADRLWLQPIKESGSRRTCSCRQRYIMLHFDLLRRLPSGASALSANDFLSTRYLGASADFASSAADGSWSATDLIACWH